MKAIIKGKRYDTDKASEVASASSGNAGDFRAYRESLYRTPRGRWFLAGRGGPMTRYAERLSDGSTSGGSRIIPLTDGDAQSWLESEGETAALEQYFSDALEDA